MRAFQHLSSHLFWPCPWCFINSCAIEEPLKTLCPVDSLQSKKTLCFPFIHGRWHLGPAAEWSCQHEPGGKAGRALCLWETEHASYISFFSLITLIRLNGYLHLCLSACSYCIDFTVFNLFPGYIKAPPGPPSDKRSLKGRV
ncbi:hypothetical protein HJG60_010787 [Phyllostomus discolor]|uniref:Uncharacterized protein n=1 Tax=Phyllostomus discolor TaxID=89673 RepID=A0A834AEI8_9CHIR|nr:hypothetical protein HJG60_010787 [Phyllostomus discolor]